MINATISEKNRTITLSKKDYTAAQKYGTPEYYELRECRNDNPGFKVVVSTKRTSKETYKGLDYDYMEAYITKYNSDLMLEYKKLRGLNENLADNLAQPYNYAQMRKWFLGKFPELKVQNETAA